MSIIYNLFLSDNSTGTIETKCVQYNTSILNWMDLINSTIFPFFAMFFLSIALIVCVYRSRSRISSRRDNRFAVSAISLNIIFFALNFPLTLYDFISYDNDVFFYFVYLLYYCYFGSSFYTQIIVNKDFRDEFLLLFNLKVVKT